MRVLDSGCANDRLYMANELLEGGTLAELLDETGPMPGSSSAPLCSRFFRAAQPDAGVVHRDLKPANVMLTNEGVVKIVDRRRACRRRGDPDRTGASLGHPAMSPEQAAGESVDEKTDQFSLGTLAHELLTGENPFAHASITKSLLLVSEAKPAQMADSRRHRLS